MVHGMRPLTYIGAPVRRRDPHHTQSYPEDRQRTLLKQRYLHTKVNVTNYKTVMWTYNHPDDIKKQTKKLRGP
jgi:hypothetical protein